MERDENRDTIRDTIRLVLAPMAGYTDGPFRRICAENGCRETVSEMISAAALHYKDKKTASLARILEGEGPVTFQIFGHDPVMMAEGAEILLTGGYEGCRYAADPAGIDINMGCPVRKITSNGDGSGLMKTPELAAKIVEAVKPVCVRYGKPLSVKIRAGWDKDSINAPEMAVMLAQAGADRVSLHCRTKEELYTPGIRLEVLADTIAALRKAAPACEIVGNGDINTWADAMTMLDMGCHGVMIGRGALGNPWIFRQILEAAAGQTPFEPTERQRREMAARLVREVVAEKGETVGIRESRGRAAYFIHGLRGSAKMRDRLNHAATMTEFLAILEEGGDMPCDEGETK
ncbi:MAG: tRNA-dihydrouridine synthase [Clostridia bacterium]|nr:tRNA-dihydrouridine synthase [Clostridia bacterium]